MKTCHYPHESPSPSESYVQCQSPWENMGEKLNVLLTGYLRLTACIYLSKSNWQTFCFTQNYRIKTKPNIILSKPGRTEKTQTRDLLSIFTVCFEHIQNIWYEPSGKYIQNKSHHMNKQYQIGEEIRTL